MLPRPKIFKIYPRINKVKVVPIKIPKKRLLFVNTLVPFFIFQSFLGVCRDYPGMKRVLTISLKIYSLVVVAAIAYKTATTDKYIFIDTPASAKNHMQILSWMNLMEYLVYAIGATFLSRRNFVAIMRKFKYIDAILNLQYDKSFNKTVMLQNYVAVFELILTHIVVEMSLYIAMGGGIDLLSPIFVFRLTRDSELTHFIVISNAINSRLHLFNRYLRSDAVKKNHFKLSRHTSLWNRYRNVNKYLNTVPHRAVNLKEMCKAYSDIVDCAKLFNETFSAQALSNGVCNFAHIMITSHMNLTLRGQEYFFRSEFHQPLFQIHLVMMLTQFVVRHVQVCYSAEQGSALSHQINLTVHRRLCDVSIDNRSRRELETLALLTSRRPLRYVIYRLFRLDLSVPLKFLSLCTGYVIVLVQFARL